ncbi:MAG: hypothetical protein AAFN79_15165, partial [Pseudomonadota bacterium]
MTIETILLDDLDATEAFRVDGINVTDRLGDAVSNAGDINGDGIDDFILGASSAGPNGFYSGEAFVVFGRTDGFPTTLSVADLDGTNGFKISGEASSDVLGDAVSAAGDLNGDGIDDILIAAPGAGPGDRGQAFVIFGTTDGFAAEILPSELDGTDGFRMTGLGDRDRLGTSVSDAGDVNGDGIADIIVSAPFSDTYGNGSGQSFVVFGTEDGFAADLDLSALDGTDGFRIEGKLEFDNAGVSVSSAGDINGDGIDDVIVGGASYYAEYASDPVNSNAEAFVIFGRNDGFEPVIDAGLLDGMNGFTIDGLTDEFEGRAEVSSAGDLNGDGFDDLIVGLSRADVNGRNNAGEAFVVFGSDQGFGARLDVSTLDGTNGFRILGASAGDDLGFAVAAAGDFNGDGIDDLLIGAPVADPNGVNSAGEAFLIFGSEDSFGATLDLADLSAADGFRFEGASQVDRVGSELSAAGDVNGDGVDDILIGVRGGDAAGRDAGEAFIVFGVRTGDDGADAISGGEQGERIRGLGGNDTLEGLGGDDTLEGGAGNDVLDGGEGVDTADFSDATSDTLAVLLNREGVAQQTLSSGRDVLSGIENLIGSDFDDRLFGDT